MEERYVKDPEYERFLERFNAILSPYAEEDYLNLPEIYPTLHVVGVPRSGTTLLVQAIATSLDVGYVNNLIAAFWRAPVYGIRLSERLLGFGLRSSYRSDFGRTSEINEPHEFGYFWTSLLQYQEMKEPESDHGAKIDWEWVQRVLINISYAFKKPVAFKSFFMIWHVSEVMKILPRTCFVRVRRDPLENALSMLVFREKMLGSKDKWVSMKPACYDIIKKNPYWIQVAYQVYYLEKALTKAINEVPVSNVLDVSLEDFRRKPDEVLVKIRDMLSRNGAQVDFKGELPKAFPARSDHLLWHEDRQRVREAIKRIYGT